MFIGQGGHKHLRLASYVLPDWENLRLKCNLFNSEKTSPRNKTVVFVCHIARLKTRRQDSMWTTLWQMPRYGFTTMMCQPSFKTKNSCIFLNECYCAVYFIEYVEDGHS